ncbi:MAG: GAF domain-containing protein [Candidatus Eremiobacterota bacterium]
MITRLLLVEDDEQGVIAARLFFDPETWQDGDPPELLVARTPAEFEELAERYGSSLDAVVADIVLGDDPTDPNQRTGMDLYAALAGRLGEVPCLAVTGQAPDSEAIKALRCGVVDYLKKPFSWRDLWARLQVQVARARLRRAQRTFHAAMGEVAGRLKAAELLTRPALSLELLRKIVEVAVLATRSSGGWLFLEREGRLGFEAGLGPPLATAVGYPRPDPIPEAGLFRSVFDSRMEQCFYLTGEEDPATLAPFEAERGAVMAVPLSSPDRVAGVLEVARERGEPPYTPNQVSLLNQFSALAAVTVEAHRGDLEASELLVRALRRALEYAEAPAELADLEAPAPTEASRRLLGALSRLRDLDAKHLEFWADTLERFADLRA